ncbi:MAG TPA: GNAT family N-acetyltransferase [Chloroflexia bacterium]|nr:GNAT family N-acetyltransferase [Chloroflexia bacterium]
MPHSVRCLTEFDQVPLAAWDGCLGASAADPVFASRAFAQTWLNAFCTCTCGDTACLCCLHLLLFEDGGTLAGVAPFYLTPMGPAGIADEQARARDTARVAARARAAAEDGAAPLARTARTQADESEAQPPPAAPQLGERVLRLVGGVAVADYLGIVVPEGGEAAAWDAVCAYWAAHGDAWDVLDLHSLSPPTADLVAASARRQGWTVWSAVEETCPAVSLPADWESYEAGLGKKDRHELRRKLRRLEAYPAAVTWRLYVAPAEVAGALDEWLDLHRLSGEAKAEFMTPAMESFFRALPAAFPGTLEIATLYVDHRPAASYLSFRAGGRLLLYNSGYDPAYRDLGTGFALLVYRIRRAIEEGITVLDFLRGDERYKYDLGGQDHFIYRTIIRK